MIGFVIALFHILGLASSLHSVMSTRTSQGTIAWVVSLNTFPYLAVPAYWILGRSRFNGYIKAHKASDKSVENHSQIIASSLKKSWLSTMYQQLTYSRQEGLLKSWPICLT
mgnify:CR=1 FL=1